MRNLCCGVLFLFNCSFVLAQEITVNLAFVQPSRLTVSAVENITLTNDSILVSKSFQVKGGSPSYQFVWKTPDGTTYHSENLYAKAAGQYILTVTDANNCSASDSIVILPVKIENKTSTNLEIYPNPASDYLIINGKNLERARLEIINVIGERIFSQNLKGLTPEKIVLPSLPAGKYVVRITRGKVLFSKKMIIQF